MKLIDMKKLAPLTLALFVFAGTAYGQDETASASTEASVNVVAGLSLSNDTPVNFGTVSQGAGTVTLEPTDGSTNNGTGTTSAGDFDLTGAAGETVQVTYDTSVPLTGSGTDIVFTPEVFGADDDNQGGSSDVQNNGSVTLGGGDYFFWVGGNIDVPNGQATGSYNGTFTMNVEYTSL